MCKTAQALPRQPGGQVNQSVLVVNRRSCRDNGSFLLPSKRETPAKSHAHRHFREQEGLILSRHLSWRGVRRVGVEGA